MAADAPVCVILPTPVAGTMSNSFETWTMVGGGDVLVADSPHDSAYFDCHAPLVCTGLVVGSVNSVEFFLTTPTPTVSATPGTPTPTVTNTANTLACSTNAADGSGGVISITDRFGNNTAVGCNATSTPSSTPTATLSVTPTPTVTLTPVGANLVLAGPTSGAAQLPVYRRPWWADLTDPYGNNATPTTQPTPTAIGTNLILAGPTSGTAQLPIYRRAFWSDLADPYGGNATPTPDGNPGTPTPIPGMVASPYPYWFGFFVDTYGRVSSPSPNATVTPVPTITPPWTDAQVNDALTLTDASAVGTISKPPLTFAGPTADPSPSPSAGALWWRSDLAGPPVPSGSPTPLGRFRMRDSQSVRSLATTDDLLGLQSGGASVSNGQPASLVNFPTEDFASITCTGTPKVCTISLASNVMRSTTAVQSSQIPSPIKIDDQDVCWGTGSNFCIRWVSASTKATLTGLAEFSGDVQLLKETAHTIKVSDSTTGNTAGGALTIKGGLATAGGLGGAGGALTLASGDATGFGVGGAVNISTGAGYTAGDITLTATTGSTTNGTIKLLAAGGLSLLPTAAQTLTVGRHTTSNTAGVGLTILSGGATSGATDKAAGTLVLSPGISTGTGEALVEIDDDTRATSTGTGNNTAIARSIIGAGKGLSNNSTTALVNFTLASNTGVSAIVRFAVEVIDGSNHVQNYVGTVQCGVINSNGTFLAGGTNGCTELGNVKTVTGSGGSTLTVTWTMTAANPAVLSVNANSGLTPSTGYPRVTYSFDNLTQQAIAVQ
jgi:hypothetical protein